MNVNGLPLIDVESLFRQLTEQGKPYSHFASCNHVILRSGSEPSTGRLLLRRKEYDNAAFNPKSLSVSFPAADGSTITLAGFHQVNAVEVIPTADNSSAAPIMVTIADIRGLGAAVNVAYNLRDAGSGNIYAATKNAGTSWTWAQVLVDLWTQAGLTGTPTAPGSYPGGIPENLNYYGYANGFKALEEFLTLCGWTLSPSTGGGFTVVAIGGTNAAPGAKWQRKYDARYDPKPLPYKIRVRFPKLPEPTDGTSNWYTVDTTTGTAGGGLLQITDTLAYSGSNAAACATQAAVRVAAWKLEAGFDKSAVYRDYWPVTGIGQQFSAVCYSFRGFGRETELIISDNPDDVGSDKYKNANDTTNSGTLCAKVINVCPKFKWIKNVVTTLTEYASDPGSAIRVQDGITVSYRGWCGYVTAAAWSASVATFTSAAHRLTVGTIITITEVVPSGYNGTFTVDSVPTVNTFTVAMAGDPGSYVSGGLIYAPNLVYCVDNPTDCCTGSECDCVCSGFSNLLSVGANSISINPVVADALGNTCYSFGGRLWLLCLPKSDKNYTIKFDAFTFTGYDAYYAGTPTTTPTVSIAAWEDSTAPTNCPPTSQGSGTVIDTGVIDTGIDGGGKPFVTGVHAEMTMTIPATGVKCARIAVQFASDWYTADITGPHCAPGVNGSNIVFTVTVAEV